MSIALDIAALTVLLLLIQEGFRRAGLWLSCAAFIVAPLALTPHWVAVGGFDWFAWLKLYTVAVSACWLAAVRFTALGRRQWAVALARPLLALNILEAVARDLAAGGGANLANALAGLLLVASLPRGAARIDDRFRDLNCSGFAPGWLVAFTLWNWAFVYLNYPFLAGHHVAVLGAALATGLLDRRRWLQARLLTLAPDLIVLATFRTTLVPQMDTSGWADPAFGSLAAGVALVAAIGTAASFAWATRLTPARAAGQ